MSSELRIEALQTQAKTYEFNVSGMSCESCVLKISEALMNEGDIQDLAVSLHSPNIRFRSEKDFDAEKVGRILAPLKKYEVLPFTHAISPASALYKTVAQYWPLVLLFSFSAGIPALHVIGGNLGFDRWMYESMGIVLVSLSYFKLLDLPKFAEGFSTYDPVAKKFYWYGYIYPFLELISGVAFLMSFSVEWVSGLVVLFLSSTTYGVVRALAEKRQFQCACLGTIFKLPLTKVTIIENTLMIAISILMLA